METLRDFPEDFAKLLRTSLNLLKIFNIRYFEDDQSFLKKNWRFSYIFGFILINSLTLLLNMPDVMTGHDMTIFSQLMPPILVTIHAIIKFIVMIPKTRQVSAFIKELASLWRVKLTLSQKQERDRLLGRLNLINRASFWTTASGAVLYCLSPLFGTLFRRIILKEDGELILLFVFSYPFNPTKNWTIYILVYIFQFYSMSLLIAMYVGGTLMMTTSCALLGIEFLMIKHDLSEVKPQPNPERINDVDPDDHEFLRIESFVKSHQQLLRLSRQLDNIFNGLVFTDLLFVGITTCAFKFMLQFARGPGYMFLSYIGIATSMFNVLYLCYYAELLTRASSSIGDIAYDNLWYKGGKHYKMAVLLIIKISQKPCCLTSLRYNVVSMKTFSKVISTTWSYFSLMNTIYSDEK